MPHRSLQPLPLDPQEQDAKFVADAIWTLTGPTKRVRVALQVANAVYYICVLGMIGWLISQAADRTAPIKLVHQEVLTGVVAAGDQIKMRYEVRRDRLCEVDTTWAFYDGANEVRRFGPSSVRVAGKLGIETVTRAYTVPANSAPGVARLVVTLAWQCPGNYLHAIYPVVMVLPDANFTIAAKRD